MAEEVVRIVLAKIEMVITRFVVLLEMVWMGQEGEEGEELGRMGHQRVAISECARKALQTQEEADERERREVDKRERREAEEEAVD